ncbi:unnamed protein product [Enterobius vermicularis]|uniref:Phosphoprotein n=1 Tax=Enterobius vermicularis TaxID=51028 RepID=A0A0N4UUE9_ENTVE|nr:unnamed protein product [Enterobius vermicularis]
MESNGESVTFAEAEMIMNLARFTDEQQHLGIDVGDWICRMTAAEESSGLPHRFSLDDIDEQSRVLSSTQKSFQQSVPKHYTFPIPPPYFVARRNSEEIPDLLTALESDSITLKAFALWDVRELAIKSGHPRNWNAVKDACMKVLTSITNQVGLETSQIHRETYETLMPDDDGNKRGGKRGATILLAGQLYKDMSLRRRVMNSDASERPPEKTTIFDALADRYIRHYKQVTDEVLLSNLVVINALDATVSSTVSRISSKFGAALRDIGLTLSEYDVLETVAGPTGP